MVYRPMQVKVLALFLSISTMLVTVPFSLSEGAATPLGTVVTKGSVTIGKSAAPTGTTVFTGDQVSSTQPALINFNSGSRIEMTKAAATFARQGKVLVIQAGQGLMRFNFQKGEEVRINAGKFVLTGSANSSRVGELGLNRDGEVVLNLTEGVFSALNTASGARTEVSVNQPLMALNANSQASAAEKGAAKTKGAAGGSTGAGTGASAGLTTGQIAALVAGVAVAGAGLAYGIHEAVKSESSR